jgi:ABC-2 type transport system permease protein
VSTARAAWLLVRLRLLRLINLAGMGFRRRRGRGVSRAATAPKRGGATLGTLVALAMVSYGFAFAFFVVQSVRHADAGDSTRIFTLIVALVSLAAFLMSLGTKELALPEWDMEWLATLPLQLGSLLVVRIVERALIVPVGWMLLWPLLSMLAGMHGAGLAAPLWGLAAALPILLAIGGLRALVDTGLRLRVGPARLRNLQALISVVGLAVFYLAIAAGLPGNSFVLDALRAAPIDLRWSPPGCAVQMTTLPSAGLRLAAAGVLAAEGVAIAGVALALLRHWLREGVVAGGARESGGRGPALVRPAERERRWLGPVHARELKLLGRDRNFLVQTMVLPALLVGTQFLFNRALVESFGQNLQRLGALSFGVAAYTLMFSAFQTLNAEGGALWLLWCVPTSLEAVLRQKARLWGLIALAYPIVLMSIGLTLRGSAPPEALWIGAIVLVGVPIYAVVATCLGVFGCNPLSQDVQRRVKPTFAYLFFLLASVYTYAIYARTVWEQLACMTLSALMAAALWQKARDRLPYLLDPTASPPPRVSLADGMVAALLFFVLQAVLAIGLFDEWSVGRHFPGQLVAVSYAVAGAVTAGLMRLLFWRQKARGVPRLLGGRALRDVALGVAAGCLAAACGGGYLLAVADTEFFRDAVKRQMDLGPDVAAWVAALAVLAAPPVEEFIFRGLIFGGLRRSLPLLPSILASAAIFAVVHPPVAVVPVFVLGLCTAFAFERSGALLAPMLAHAVYNGAMMLMPLERLT